MAARGLGILVADFYSLAAEVLYIENSFIPDNINPWPLRISALIGLIFFVGGVVVGIYRSVLVVREPRERKKGYGAECDRVLFNFVLVMDRAGSTELPARLLEVAHQQDSHDVLYVNLGTVEIEGSNAGERQSQFEAASEWFLSKLSSADVSIQELESRRGYARRVISLEPTNGQAGILIAPELLNKWLPYSPRIAIDA